MSSLAAHEAGQSFDCRVPGCTQEARHNRGPYAFLCDEHKRAKQNAPPAPRPIADPAGEGSFEAKARGLVAIGRMVDRAYRLAELARAKCEKPLGSARKAKADADALAEEFRRTVRELGQ
jgi:hypothetical protein